MSQSPHKGLVSHPYSIADSVEKQKTQDIYTHTIASTLHKKTLCEPHVVVSGLPNYPL